MDNLWIVDPIDGITKTFTSVYVCMYDRRLSMYVYLCACLPSFSVCICMCMCMYVCMFVELQEEFNCMYVCMYVCMQVCMHICV